MMKNCSSSCKAVSVGETLRFGRDLLRNVCVRRKPFQLGGNCSCSCEKAIILSEEARVGD